MIDTLDTLRAELGRKADAASATGSLHAKVKEILNRLPAAGITSVQYGTVTLNDVSSATATIASVDTTRSIVLYLGEDKEGDSHTSDARVALTNATTVTATRETASAGHDTIVSFVVMTFSGVVSLQTGTVSITTTDLTGTATVTAVVTARTALFYLGKVIVSNTVHDSAIRMTLTNATTITATRTAPSVSQTATIGFALVEF